MESLLRFSALLADLATVAAAIGLYWVYRALKYNNVDAWNRAHDQYMKEATPDMRSRVFAHYDTALPFASWPQEDQEAGMDLCRILEAVCFYETALGTAFWESFGHPVGKAYLLLKDAMQKAREKDRRARKWSTFERIGQRALKRYPEIKAHFGHSRQSGEVLREATSQSANPEP